MSRLISRHAVGTSGRLGQWAVKTIGPYRRRPCLGVAAKDEMCAPQLRWAFPGIQRVRGALFEIEGKTKVKVNH